MRLLKLAFAASLAVAPFATAEAQYFSNATTPTRDNTPFWDVRSQDDGDGCNIGYVLTGALSECKNNQLLGTYSAPFNSTFQGVDGNQAWFAHSFGNIDASVGFGFFAGAGSTVTYFGGIAGATPLKDLALRDLNTGSIVHTFKQLDASTHTYTLTGNLFFDVGISLFTGGTAYSWTSEKPNQFAAFGNGMTYANSAGCGASGCWVGAEDVKGADGDYDYNDGVLRITGGSIVVPEPASALLVMSGLAGLVGVARRRKQV